MAQGWHEDFEDCPAVEERYDGWNDLIESDGECECDECDECSERLWSEYEEDQDHLLAQQELEDYEGLSFRDDEASDW